MARAYIKRVYSIIDSADIVLEIVDARFVELTRNKRIEENIEQKGKKLIIIINKADLASKKENQRQKRGIGKQCVFMSAKKKKGILRLREAIGKNAENKKVKVAVIGFPNTGKSSVINCLKGKGVARVSSRAGFTRGEQIVRIAKNIVLIDTPGIIPFEEKDTYELVIIGAKNSSDLDDVELGGLKLLQYLQENAPEKMEKLTGKENAKKPVEEILDIIAIKWRKFLKGEKPDTNTTAMLLLKNWQQGKI